MTSDQFPVLSFLRAKDLLFEIKFEGIKPSTDNKPLGIILGGQPASGKTKLIQQIQTEIYPTKDFIIINGDEFRAYHPQYIDIIREYGKDSPDKTQFFANRLVSAIKDECLERRYNFILESTFRNIKTIKETSEEFKKNDYNSETHALAIPYKDSLLGIFERYEGEMDKTGFGRFSSLDVHNEAFDKLPENLNIVAKEALFDKIFVYSRNENGNYKAALEIATNLEKEETFDLNNEFKRLRKSSKNKSFYYEKFVEILELASKRGESDTNYLSDIMRIIEKYKP